MTPADIRFARIASVDGDLVVVSVETWPEGREAEDEDLIPSETATVGDIFVDGDFVAPTNSPVK